MNDPILDAPINTQDTAYALITFHWRDVIEQARRWYVEYAGHEPADSDLGHGFFRAMVEGARWGTLRHAFQDTWPIAAGPAPTPMPSPGGPLPNAGETGRLSARDCGLWREDGSLYGMLGATDFLLLWRQARGEDVDPILTDRIVDPENGDPRANLVRVLATFDWRNQSGPQFDFNGGVGPRIAPDDESYWTGLRPSADRIFVGRGLRIEYTFGDLIRIFGSDNAALAFAEKFCTVLEHHPGVIIDTNESGHVDQVGPEVAYEIGKIAQRHGLLAYSGRNDIPNGASSIPVLDIFGNRADRKPDFPRTGRALGEIQRGFTWADGSAFNGVRVYCVDQEGMGADEIFIDGKRSNVPIDFRYYGACQRLFGGGVLHSTDGLLSKIWRPIQQECAREYFFAARFIPAEAMFAPYQRGAAEKDGGGFGPGVGDMPFAHFDLEEVGKEPRALRSFDKIVGPFAYGVAIRATQEHVTPRDGWIVDAEPRRGLVRLRR